MGPGLILSPAFFSLVIHMALVNPKALCFVFIFLCCVYVRDVVMVCVCDYVYVWTGERMCGNRRYMCG